MPEAGSTNPGERPEPEFGAVLSAAQAEEAWAFEELFRRVARMLGGYLRVRGATDWEGLANEVLLRAFRAIAGFSGTEPQFRAWLFSIARNALIDEHRRALRRPTLESVVPDALPDPASLDDEMRLAGEEERVGRLLACLSDEQREVLLLRVVADLSVEATAEVMGKTSGAIRALQHRGIQKLRNNFARSPSHEG